MHIPAISIKNIRSLHTHKWFVPRDKCAGWHVILGDNGSGKSSFLRAIALALAGPRQAEQLRQAWSDWLTRSRPEGHIELQVAPKLGCDGLTRAGGEPTFHIGIGFVRQGEVVEPSRSPEPPKEVGWSHPRGWFSASFGPFRRFSGGDARLGKSFGATSPLARHLSMFDEGVALTECLEWLRDLKFRALEHDPEGVLLQRVMEFVNQGDFLPSNVRLEDVTSRNILFRDANGVELPVGDLSDGYRSILSLTFELIRQMAKAFGPEGSSIRLTPLESSPKGWSLSTRSMLICIRRGSRGESGAGSASIFPIFCITESAPLSPEDRRKRPRTGSARFSSGQEWLNGASCSHWGGGGTPCV